MSTHIGQENGTEGPARHRWLVGLEPIFEGGWLHRGFRGRRWAVEDVLTAVALLGDVTIELAHTKSLPRRVAINAWSIFRDVDVIVPAGTKVELAGHTFRGELTNRVSEQPSSPHEHVVSIRAYALLGDVSVRMAGHTLSCE